MTAERVPGHALRVEGQPFAADGSRRMWPSEGKAGCALCECGELSPVLANSAERRMWHREHKAEVAG